jgi:TM2 domain-containing membrane protein YozV
MSDNSSRNTPPPAPPVVHNTASSNQDESNKTILPIVLFLILLPTVHRFYVGKIGTGLLFFFTVGGLGIWWIYDVIISITGNFTDKQGRKITRWT